MRTLHAFPPWIPRRLQRKPVLRAELLQLRHHARRDEDAHGRVQRVHECLEERQLVPDRVAEEVRVQEDWVGRLERGVVREEEVGGLGGSGRVS